MKQILLFVLSFFAFVSVSLAQQDSLDNQRTHYVFSTGMSGGSSFWGDRFTSSYLSFGVSHQLDSNLRLRINASAGSFNSSLIGNYQDKAPYRNPINRTSAEVGADYQLNPRLQLSVTAYFDRINLGSMNNNLHTSNLTTTAFNANLTYKFRNDSFINLSVTFMETNNPYNACLPYYMNSFGGFNPMQSHNGFINSSIFDW